MAVLAGPGRDAGPLQPVLERVLAERDEEPVRAVEHHAARLVGELPPRDVDRAAVRAKHLVEHRERHLRVHQVAVRRRDPERALAKRPRRIGDEELRIEPVLEPEPLAGGAGALAVPREEPARGRHAGRSLAEARVEEAQEVPHLGHRADGGARVPEAHVLPDGDRGAEPVDAADRRAAGSPPANCRAKDGISSRKRRCPSRRRVSKASDDLPEPETPVTTVSRPARDLEVEALEVVLARAPDDDRRAGAGAGHRRRILSRGESPSPNRKPETGTAAGRERGTLRPAARGAPMTKTPHTRSGQLRGLGRLAAEATLGVTELVEAMHQTISAGPGPLGTPPAGPTRGITGVVYGNVRGVTRLVGSGVDAALARLAPAPRRAEALAPPRRDPRGAQRSPRRLPRRERQPPRDPDAPAAERPGPRTGRAGSLRPSFRGLREGSSSSFTVSA